jgi:hypothetical protein
MNTGTARDDRWILRARDLLQQEASRPDPALQRRLAAIRQQALGPARRSPTTAAAGAVAALLVLGIGVWQQLLPAGAPAVPALEAPALRAESPLEQALTLPADDLALIAESDDLALLQDLEFYVWLEGADHDG